MSEVGGQSSEIRGHRSDVSLRPEERLPVAKELGETSLMFLVHPTLGEREMKETVRAVRELMLGQKKMLGCGNSEMPALRKF